MSEQSEQHQDAIQVDNRRLKKRHFAGALAWPFLWIVLIIGGAALALVSIRGQTVAAPQWIKSELKSRLETAMPERRIQFGDVYISMTEDWVPGLEVQNIEVAAKDGPVQLRLTDISGQVGLGPLMRGQVALKNLNLSGGQVSITRDLKGQYRFSLGDGVADGQAAKSIAELVLGLDNALSAPELADLSDISMDGVTVRYDDLKSHRSWVADGGRARLDRLEDAVSIRADVALLGGYDYATTLAVNYATNIGEPNALFGMTVDDMPSRDLALQAPALAWLDVLNAPISGAMRGSVDENGKIGPMHATLEMGAGVLQPDPAVKALPFDGGKVYFNYFPERQELRFDQLWVDSKWFKGAAEGSAFLNGIENGQTDSLTGQFRFSNVLANPYETFEQPVELDRANLDFRMTLAPFQLEIGQLVFQRDNELIHGTGQVLAPQDGWHVAVDTQIDTITPERVLSYWPDSQASVTRDWVTKNLKGGSIKNASFSMRLNEGKKPDIYFDFDYSNVAVRFMPQMPMIERISGHAQMMKNRLVVRADQGQLSTGKTGVLDISGSTYIIKDTSSKPAQTELRLNANGPVLAVLDFIDRDPFRFLAKADQPSNLATGRADINGTLRLPIKKGLSEGEVDVDLTAVARDVKSSGIIPGKTIRSDRLDIRVTNRELAISGKATVGKVPFDGRWVAAIGPAANGRSRLKGSVRLSQAFADEFGIGLPKGSVTGSSLANIDIGLRKGQSPSFEMSSNLVGLGLKLSPVGWAKSQKSKGSLLVSGGLGNVPKVDALRLIAPGMDAKGSVTLNAKGGLDRARFTSVKVDNWLNAAVDLIGRGRNAIPAVAVRGGTLDMRKTSVGTGTGSGATGGGGPITVQLDRVRVTDKIALTNVKGKFTSKNGLDGSFTGFINGKAPISGNIVPKNGRSGVRVISNNAGEVISAAGIGRDMRGGSFSLSLVPIKQAGSYDGQLTVRNTRIKNVPFLAGILNAVSVVGLLEQLNGSGIHFGEIDAVFRLTPSQAILTRSHATGASMGISADGVYDFNTNALDFQGVFSPIYAVNGIGAIFTRKGEGLIGFNYTIKGSGAQPKVRVNPLSVFTPGMFRDIFRRPPPKVN